MKKGNYQVKGGKVHRFSRPRQIWLLNYDRGLGCLGTYDNQPDKITRAAVTCKRCLKAMKK